MQKEIDNVFWEEKNARDRQFTSNLNGNNNACLFAQMCIDLGIYKYKNNELQVDEKAETELVTRVRGKQQMFHDWGNEGAGVIKTFGEEKALKETSTNIEDTCESCGKPFTEGELRWQKNNPEDAKFCYKCKKEKGLVKAFD